MIDGIRTTRRMFKKVSSAAAASEGPKAYSLRYVEALGDARTKLGAFFNILLDNEGDSCLN